MTLSDCSVAGNMSTGYGGGLFNQGTLTVTHSTISGNSAGSFGGGILNYDTLTVSDSTVSDNTAAYGGGISDNGGTATIADSTIVGNSANVLGGGIYSGGTLTAVNTTIAYNQTGSYGGGIYNGGTLTAVNTTIAYNYAADYGPFGGGLYDNTGATATLDNTIVDANTAAGADDIDGAAGSVAGQFDLVGGDNTGSLTNGNNGNQVGVTNPGLASGLANNGGPTQTIALLAGSPAIGAGMNGVNGFTLLTDQRGYVPPAGVWDIGAYQCNAVPPSAPTATLSAANVTGANYDQTTYNFSITYASNAAIAASTLAGAVVQVVPPSSVGSPITATVVSTAANGPTDPFGNAQSFTVTYEITPPGGSWSPADNGTYLVTLGGSPVTDIDGTAIASGNVGSFAAIIQSIIVLDHTAGGALTVSGNASIDIPGGVFVDSSSTSALSASGNAQVKASVIDVHGGVQKSGNASFSPAPTTGAPTVSDPLVGLTAPTYSGTPISENLSGNSTATINPGVYSQITLSGNARLTLNPGIYVIAGGGLSVSGNASAAGTGVMIYNTKSSTGTYGSVTLSGNGAISLTAPTTGTYAGILIFQDRANTKALTFSGNAMQGMAGTIYAPAAQLAESGNAQIGSTSNPVSIIVDTLTISGNSVANTVTLSSPTGTVAYTPAQIRAAYGINGLGDGTGQTIAIVDAYDDPAMFQALDAFDSQFGLTSSGPTLYSQYGPASSFLTVLNQYGQATSLPGTDPNGPGTDNWEVEEALDVEWAHAIAPGAQIILVEANSQSLADLMAGVATAASQPGVSVVSMSWGFPEGQAVVASDEATYDRVLTTPGVTFVASAGDYGAADPEYPAYSPNVVAVGGTSLALNADNSYNSETGWGYYAGSVGTFIGSGGGISLYEPEPAYQLGVQSTGYRTTPDVSLVADPATGAWIADPYNLDPSNPFEIVGGTSLSAPAWAGLLALVNQGRAAAGALGAGLPTAPLLNSSSPTETQQALYMLPQSDYNAINSGTNGYSAGTGYNLVTGLGTPVANRLVPDLIAYQGPGTSYAGPTVGHLQDAGLVNTGTSGGGPMDVFSVFDALTLAGGGPGDAQGQVATSNFSSTQYESLATGVPGRTGTGPPIAAGFTALGPASSLSPAGLMPLPAGGLVAPLFPTLSPPSKGGVPEAGGWGSGGVVPAQSVTTSPLALSSDQGTNRQIVPIPDQTRLRSGQVPDSVLDELAGVGRTENAGERAEATGDRSFLRPPPSALRPSGVVADPAVSAGPMSRQDPPRQSATPKARLVDILLAAGFCSFGAGILGERNSRGGRLRSNRVPRSV